MTINTIDYQAYSKMLTTQVDMCFPFEYGFYKETILDEHKNILEIGCGNGTFLRTLSQYYPEKKYTGFDYCKQLIEIANESSQQIDFQFGSTELLKYHEYDLVILRLIVHQLENREEFISDLSDHLVEGARVIIVEPFDDKFQMTPRLPAFNEHLKKHREVLSPNTASRNLKSSLQKEMESFNFSLIKENDFYVPSLLPDYRKKYYDYMVSTSRIIGCEQDVLDDIATWYDSPDSFVQIGLFMNCYIKLNSEKINVG